jgi:hypothetical protein
MAICDVCKQEMNTVVGCKPTVIVIGGYGWQRLTAHDLSSNGRCHDCNAVHGEFHHPGCDMERCPVCGGQLISCGCLDDVEMVVREVFN